MNEFSLDPARPSASVGFPFLKLKNCIFTVTRRPRLYGRIRTTSAATLQHSHAAAISNDQFGRGQQRSFHGDNERFARRILFRDVGSAEAWNADRSDVKDAGGDHGRRGANDELYRARGASENATV